MRVLVTGGAGYVGSHACKALAAAGHLPITYDNLRTGHAWAVRWGPFEPGDINDAAQLADAFRRHRPDAVMHFAALAYVGESTVSPDLYYRTNVAGTIGLLDAMRAHDVRRMVFSSTCATYGEPERQPIAETAPQQPVSPYGRSKLMVEHILADHCAAFPLAATALRYFNAAGADPDGELGEEHDPEPHLIPIVLQTALGLRGHVEVYGDDYPTPDGTCVRDYVHVTDLAAAHVAALERGGEGDFRAYNLGTGEGASVRAVIEAARRVTGRAIAVRTGSRRQGDAVVLVADASRAKAALGWTPRRSSLDEVIESAWRWVTRHRASVGLPVQETQPE